MNKGYALERFVETEICKLADQSLSEPIYSRTHRVPTSGAHRGEKGDVITVGIQWLPQQLMFECKRRGERSPIFGAHFSLYNEWLIKNENEANEYGLFPIFVGSFTGVKQFRIFVVLKDNAFGVLWSKPKISISLFNNNYYPIFYLDIYRQFFDKMSNIIGLEPNYLLISWENFFDVLKKMKTKYQLVLKGGN